MLLFRFPLPDVCSSQFRPHRPMAHTTGRAPPFVPTLRVVSFILLIVVGVAASHGADSSVRASGAVTGRVENSATGQYLNNARVAVAGTDLVAFTDQSGIYHLTGVPAGPIVLRVYYTGLEPRDVAAQIGSGATAVQDVDLASGVTDAGLSGGMKLD